MLAVGGAHPPIDGVLPLVARRIVAVGDVGALMLQVWDRAPSIIIVERSPELGDVAALCRQIRQFFQTPIMVLEEGAGEGERISWLDSGADDVLARTTAGPAELVARCHALLRRVHRQIGRDPASARLHALGMQLDIAGRRLYPARGRPLDLSASATRLLALFFSHGDALVPTALIDQHLSGAATGAARERGAALIKQLNRRMAGLPAPAPRIERVRGSGFRLALVGDAPRPRSPT